MNGKVFIDTNVLVYAHTDLDPRKQLLAQNLILDNDTFISTQVLQEISNVLFKKVGKSWSEIEGVLPNLGGQTLEMTCKIVNPFRYL